jgi:hypothetical protein
MTCSTLQRLVQALSTSFCFVSNFEIRVNFAMNGTLTWASRNRLAAAQHPPVSRTAWNGVARVADVSGPFQAPRDSNSHDPVMLDRDDACASGCATRSANPSPSTRTANAHSAADAGPGIWQQARRSPDPSEASDRKVAEPADKPGSVVDSHSSRRTVTGTLEQPTRTRRGQRHEVPIWSCSRWGLPCRSVARLAVRSYRTISPLPSCLKQSWAVSFCCTFRRLAPPRRYLAPCPVEPGLSSASPDASTRDDATVWPTPPRALSHAGDTVDRRPALTRRMHVPATW